MHIRDENLTAALSENLPDGPLLTAVYARVDTAAGFARMLTPLGNYLIARPAARAKAHEITEETNVALDAAMVIGVTASNLHIWSADPMLSQVGDHLATVPRTSIAGISAGTGKSWLPLTIALADGHRIEVQARGNVHGLITDSGR